MEIQATSNTSTDKTPATPSAGVAVPVTKSVYIALATITESVSAKQSAAVGSVDAKTTVTESVSVTQSTITESCTAIQSELSGSVNHTKSKVTKSFNKIQAKNTSARETYSKLKEKNEKVRMAVMSQKRLNSVIEKLESVSNKFFAASVAYEYDEFGKYISSLLRGLPTRKVNSLRKKIIVEVLEALNNEEKELLENMKTVGTQVDLDVFMAPDKSYTTCINEQYQTGNNCINVGAKSLTSEVPVLGGNRPLVFPDASSSESLYKLPPVITMSAASRVSSVPVVTRSFIGSVTSGQPVPLSPCETITTIAKSAGGTLLAFTIPKHQKIGKLVGPDQPLLQTSRDHRCKQAIAAYLMKKCSRVSPQTISVHDNSTLGSHSISQMNYGRSEEQEFDIDIEEGNELAQIKQDKEFFEDNQCGESSEIIIKEEASYPEISFKPAGNSLATSTPFNCSLCNDQFEDRDKFISHFSTTHVEQTQMQCQRGKGSKSLEKRSTEGIIVCGSETRPPESPACVNFPQSLCCNSDIVDKCVATRSLDSLQYNNDESSNLQLPESSPQHFSLASNVLNPDKSFEFINYNSSKESFNIPVHNVKNCLPIGKSLSCNEFVPVARVIRESNYICEGGTFTQTEDVNDSKEQTTEEDILVSTSFHRTRKGICSSDISEEYINDPDSEEYINDADCNDISDEPSVKDERGFKKIQATPFVPNCVTKKINFSTAVKSKVRVKRVRNKDFCFYCKDWVSSFSRHVIRIHKHESDIQEIRSKVPGSLERKELISIIRKKGNFLASGTGVKRAVKKSTFSDTKLVPCTFCLGFYSRKYVWRHRRTCFMGPETANTNTAHPHGQKYRSKRPQLLNDMAATLLHSMEKRKKPKMKNKTKDVIFEHGLLDSKRKAEDDSMIIMKSSISSKPLTSDLSHIEVGLKLVGQKTLKRCLTKWLPEEKAIVAEYFQNHIKECKPPRKKECEEVMMKNKNLFKNKTWLKIKVFVQNLYTKKTKL